MNAGTLFGIFLVLAALAVIGWVLWAGIFGAHETHTHTPIAANPSNDATVRDARLPEHTPTSGATPENNG